jgi:hypothetical protein
MDTAHENLREEVTVGGGGNLQTTLLLWLLWHFLAKAPEFLCHSYIF